MAKIVNTPRPGKLSQFRLRTVLLGMFVVAIVSFAKQQYDHRADQWDGRYGPTVDDALAAFNASMATTRNDRLVEISRADVTRALHRTRQRMSRAPSPHPDGIQAGCELILSTGRMFDSEIYYDERAHVVCIDVAVPETMGTMSVERVTVYRSPKAARGNWLW